MDTSSQFNTPLTLPLGREFPVPIEQEAWWVAEPVWSWWKKEKFLPVLGIEHQTASH